MEQNQVSTSRSWLQRLKDESWEAELLVSAAAIFIIFKSFNVFDWVCNFFIDWLNPDQYFVGYMITLLGFLAFGILGALFVLHFAFRAYWIGLVGLNSVFSDYSIDDSVYSKTYTEKMLEKLPKLSKSIATLDEICSSIFSVAFTLLIMYLYLGIISSIYLLIFNFLIDYVPAYIILIPLIMVSILYLAQMTLTIVANIKKFKQHTKIQTWYYYSTIWGSAILYGPLYKNLLQVTMIFGSNFKKKKALVNTMIFMLVFGMMLGMYRMFQSNIEILIVGHPKLDITRAQPYFYKNNNRDKSFLIAPEIEADLISKKAVQLFIPIFEHELTQLKKTCSFDQNSNDDALEKVALRQQKKQELLNCYQNNHHVLLNNQAILVDFLKTDHEFTNQFGIKAFLDLSKLEQGNHIVTVIKRKGSEDEQSWIIPFYLSK